MRVAPKVELTAGIEEEPRRWAGGEACQDA